MFPRLRSCGRFVLRASCVALLLYLGLVVVFRPSNDRPWSKDQEQLATASFEGEGVRVRNVRNAFYRSTDDYDVRWEERAYDLAKLESVWFVVEPFSDWRGPAHTFLSFGFEGGDYLAISVEVRKEVGESFSPWAGLLRQYEITYVVGDEKDLIGLRANHRRDRVYLYPVRTTPKARRRLFVAMLERANQLAERPEFYNTLTSTCTTNIVRHINTLVPSRVPWSYKVLLPAHSDELAYDLGLIDTELPRHNFRDAHLINDLAEQHATADGAGFSAGIRQRVGERSGIGFPLARE